MSRHTQAYLADDTFCVYVHLKSLKLGDLDSLDLN